jgi:hypothetical protein
MLLGVLIAQVWHWYSWIDRERKFIRIIVVSPSFSNDGMVKEADDSTGSYSGHWPQVDSL